jgi:uncharacterized protein YbbK (DUF523 family)
MQAMPRPGTYIPGSRSAQVTVVKKIKIGIGSCLLGEKVRYDGGHKLDRYITETLGQYFDYVSVCPEVEYGNSIGQPYRHPSRCS